MARRLPIMLLAGAICLASSGCPAWSFDHINIMTSNVGRLTPEGKSYLARNSRLVFDDWPMVLPVVKSHNPASRVLIYDNFTNLVCSRGGWEKHKWDYARNWCREKSVDIETLFVHFAEETVIRLRGENRLIPAGERVPTFYWSPARYVCNVGSPVYRDFARDYAVYLTTAYRFEGFFYDGIFEDNCVFDDGSITDNPLSEMGPAHRVGKYTVIRGGKIREYPGAEPGLQFTRDHLTLDRRVFEALKKRQKILIGNGSQFYADNPLYQKYGPDRLTVNWENAAGGYWAAADHDGVFREFMVIAKQMSWADRIFVSPTVHLPTQAEYVRQMGRAGKITIIHHRRSYTEEDYLKDPGLLSGERDRMFGLGYYYLLHDPNYTYYFPPIQAPLWPAVGYDIGQPRGNEYVFNDTKTDPDDGQPAKVFGRRFSRALVLVRPKYNWRSRTDEASAPVAYDLKGKYQRLRYDGKLEGLSDRVALRNAEAAILIPEAGAPRDRRISGQESK